MQDERELTYPFIAPSRVQAKEIAWDDHVNNCLRVLYAAGMQEGKDIEINKSELSIKFKGYGKVTLDGADNIESLRGKSNWGLVCLDEFSSWKNARYAFEEVVEPNLLPNKSPVIVGGTPRGFNYFHLLAKRGDHKSAIEGSAEDDEGRLIQPNPAFQVYRFTSYENQYIDKDWVDERRKTMSEAAFAQEYLARFEKFTGLIFRDFSREIHVVQNVDLPGGDSYFRAIDFGANNPTACLFIRVDSDDNFYVFDEYYQSEKTIDYHAGQILSKYPTIRFTASYGDPSGLQAMLDYARWGVHITKANKRILDTTTGNMGLTKDTDWVRHGIELISQRFKISAVTKKPKLFIHARCVNLIGELENYRWMENNNDNLNEKDMPIKVDDHAIDSLRYFVVSYSKVAQRVFRQPPPLKINPITGY